MNTLKDNIEISDVCQILYWIDYYMYVLMNIFYTWILSIKVDLIFVGFLHSSLEKKSEKNSKFKSKLECVDIVLYLHDLA